MATYPAPSPRAGVVEIAGMKLQAISWEKENWLNVPDNIRNHFQVLSNNTTKAQGWSTKIEDKLKDMELDSEQLNLRMAQAEDAGQDTRMQLRELSAEVLSMKERSSREFATFHSCVREILQVTCTFIASFIKIFDGTTGNAVENNPVHSKDLRDDAELKHLDVLESLRQKLSDQQPQFCIAFAAWETWNASMKETDDRLHAKNVELQKASESTRERLLQWRNLLTENSHLLDCLSGGLAHAQGEIRALQSTRVAHEELDAAIAKTNEETATLRNITEERLMDVGKHLENKMSEADSSLRSVERQFIDSVAELHSNVKTMLEQSLNPMNAYLNTMHVKSSTMRMEIDNLSVKMPALKERIGEAFQQLEAVEENAREQREQLKDRLEELASEAIDGVQKGVRERMDIYSSIGDVKQELHDQVQELRSKLDNNSGALEILKSSDLPQVSREFLSLEQKVAKWVRTDAMPTRMNEARLYALETKLAQEMESRLQLEEFTRENVGKEFPLPSIPQPVAEVPSHRTKPLPSVSRYTLAAEEGSFQVEKHVAKHKRPSRALRAIPNNSHTHRGSATHRGSTGVENNLELCLT